MKYETKDSGKREVSESGYNRDVQEDKPRFDLMIPTNIPYEETLIYRWAMLMTRGAVKYGEGNFMLANTEQDLKRFKSSACRHFFQFLSGLEDEDHLAAVLFNLNGYVMVKYLLRLDKSE